MLINHLLEILEFQYKFPVSTRKAIENMEILSYRLYAPQVKLEEHTLYIVPESISLDVETVCSSPEITESPIKEFCFLQCTNSLPADSVCTDSTELTRKVLSMQSVIFIQASFLSVINALQETLEQNQRISHYFQPLYRLAHRGIDVHSFLKNASKMLQNDLMIISSGFEIVGMTIHESTHAEFTERKNKKTQLSHDAIAHIKGDSHFRDMVSGRTAFYVDNSFFRYPTIICGIMIGDQFIGYILMLETMRSFQPQDYALVSYLAELSAQMVYTVPLENNLFAYNVNTDYFLNHLLNSSRQIMEDLSSLFGWEKYLGHPYYQLFICSYPIEKKKQAQFHFYHQIQQILPDYPIMRTNHLCIVLLYGNHRQLLTPSLKHILEDLLSQQHSHATLSLEYTDINRTAFYYKYTLSLLEKTLTSQKKTDSDDGRALPYFYTGGLSG